MPKVPPEIQTISGFGGLPGRLGWAEGFRGVADRTMVNFQQVYLQN
jgi:hypothetical protein